MRLVARQAERGGEVLQVGLDQRLPVAAGGHEANRPGQRGRVDHGGRLPDGPHREGPAQERRLDPRRVRYQDPPGQHPQHVVDGLLPGRRAGQVRGTQGVHGDRRRRRCPGRGDEPVERAVADHPAALNRDRADADDRVGVQVQAGRLQVQRAIPAGPPRLARGPAPGGGPRPGGRVIARGPAPDAARTPGRPVRPGHRTLDAHPPSSEACTPEITRKVSRSTRRVSESRSAGARYRVGSAPDRTASSSRLNCSRKTCV